MTKRYLHCKKRETLSLKLLKFTIDKTKQNTNLN